MALFRSAALIHASSPGGFTMCRAPVSGSIDVPHGISALAKMLVASGPRVSVATSGIRLDATRFSCGGFGGGGAATGASNLGVMLISLSSGQAPGCAGPAHPPPSWVPGPAIARNVSCKSGSVAYST
jgi:hypothetical protein